MQISVIIPVYNREHLIMRALDSVCAQSSDADEIIVVDDGSTDATAHKVCSNYPHVKIIQQCNRGVSAARNSGIRKASHDWIALLDSDDEWLPNKLQSVRRVQAEYPHARVFHSDEIWIRNGTRVNAMKKHQKKGGMIFEHCLPLCVISPSAVVIHRNRLDEVGLFNESMRACEDYDLWLRLCHRFPVHYIDRPLIKKYGGHDDQLSKKYWGMDRFRIRALHNLMQLSTLEAQQRLQAREMLCKKLNILIKGARKHKNQAVLDEFEPLLTEFETSSC